MADNKNTRAPKGGGPGSGPRGYEKPKDLAKTVLRMFSYLTRRPILLVLVVIFVVCSSLGNVAATYMMRPILNALEAAFLRGEHTLPSLLTSCVQLMALYLVTAACTYGQANLMAQLAQKGCNALRRDLFDKLQQLPLSYFDRHTHGELMSRFTNDADNVQMALEQSLIQLVSSVLSFAGTVIMMIYLSPILFLISVAVLAVIITVFKVLGNLGRTYYGKQQAALGAVNGDIQEMIEGMKVVKAFTHEEEVKAQFAALNEEYRVSSSKAAFYTSSVMPITANITNVGYAVTAAAGGFLAIVAGFDIGGLATYLNYCRQITMPINQVSMQMTTLLSALAGAERIFNVMDAQPEVDEGQVTLIPMDMDANGAMAPFSGKGRPRAWAWKVPRGQGLTLVPVWLEGKEPMELCPAKRTAAGLSLLAPHQDATDSIWVRVEQDGTLIPVENDQLSAHGWAWKYAEPDGKVSLHLVRGSVRNVPGEEFCYAQLKGAVRFNHVDFSYVPDKRILKNVSVYANPGQKIAFVGSTGAGKTTITNLINRFYEIEGGLITYDGIDVRAIAKDSLRASLGIVLQDTHLFTGTVMENIRYGRLDATDEECMAAARTANADSFIRRLPDGYQTVITGDGANLSQGQRQLLAIARAAVADPPVMILDEATSSIDTRTEQHIQKGMDALMEGRTVFVIAHRLSTVRNADCIVVIEHGEIMEKGNHQELLAQKGRYYQLYTGQFELD